MGEVKMFWDFKGPNSKKTAEHHCIHLKEFFEVEEIQVQIIEVEEYTPMFSAAIAIVDEEHVSKCREQLKPNRGQLA